MVKRCQVGGMRFESRSEAIRALLSANWRKSEIAKKIKANYHFVMSVESKMKEEEEQI